MKEDYIMSDEIHWNSFYQRLEIDLSKMLNRHCTVYIESWCEGLQWHSITEDGFEQPTHFYDPGFDLLSQTQHSAIAQWISNIPEEIVTNIRHLRVGQFEMLQMCRQWKEATNLLKDLPLTLWLLHLFSSKQKWSRHVIKKVLQEQAHQIMQSIGLQGSVQSISVLKKITVNEFDLYDAELLRHCLGSVSIVEELSRYSTITKYNLLAFYNFPWAANQPLGKVISAQTKTLQTYLTTSNLIKDCHRLVATKTEEKELVQCLSAADLKNFQHKQCTEKLRHIFVPSLYPDFALLYTEAITMPLPPHPGTDEVKPVDSLIELSYISERAIGNRASWIKRVLEGKYYFYLVTYNSRDILLGVTVDSNKIQHLNWIEHRLPYPQPLPTSVTDWLVSLSVGA